MKNLYYENDISPRQFSVSNHSNELPFSCLDSLSSNSPNSNKRRNGKFKQNDFLPHPSINLTSNCDDLYGASSVQSKTPTDRQTRIDEYFTPKRKLNCAKTQNDSSSKIVVDSKVKETCSSINFGSLDKHNKEYLAWLKTQSNNHEKQQQHQQQQEQQPTVSISSEPSYSPLLESERDELTRHSQILKGLD